MSHNLETDEEDEDNADDKRKKNKKEEYVKDGLDVDTFVRWKQLYKNEAFVKDMEKQLADLMHQVFELRKIENLSFEDEIGDFTKEKYIQIYEKIWASIRHDIWKQIQITKKEDRVDVVPP